MIKCSMEHLAIMAQDSEALANWYSRMFGMKVVYKGSKTPPTFFVAPPEGGAMIEIIPTKALDDKVHGEEEQGLRHFALAVEDIDAAHKTLQENNVEIMSAKEASGGVKVVFFRDPENNIVQLIYRPTPLV